MTNHKSIVLSLLLFPLLSWGANDGNCYVTVTPEGGYSIYCEGDGLEIWSSEVTTNEVFLINTCEDVKSQIMDEIDFLTSDLYYSYQMLNDSFLALSDVDRLAYQITNISSQQDVIDRGSQIRTVANSVSNSLSLALENYMAYTSSVTNLENTVTNIVCGTCVNDGNGGSTGGGSSGGGSTVSPTCPCDRQFNDVIRLMNESAEKRDSFYSAFGGFTNSVNEIHDIVLGIYNSFLPYAGNVTNSLSSLVDSLQYIEILFSNSSGFYYNPDSYGGYFETDFGGPFKYVSGLGSVSSANFGYSTENGMTVYDQFVFYEVIARNLQYLNNGASYIFGGLNNQTNLLHSIYSEISTNGNSAIVSRLDSVTNFLYSISSNQYYHTQALLSLTNLIGSIDERLGGSLETITNTLNDILATNSYYVSVFDERFHFNSSPLSDFDATQYISYHAFLTNYYLSVSSPNPSASLSKTNWFDRIEMLLSALVFTDDGTPGTNTVDSSNMETDRQQMQNFLSNVSGSASSQIDMIDSTGQTLLSSLVSYSHIFSTVSLPSNVTLVNTSGDDENPGFVITMDVESGRPLYIVCRSVTTLCWVFAALFLLYRFLWWSCRNIYNLVRFCWSVATGVFGK